MKSKKHLYDHIVYDVVDSYKAMLEIVMKQGVRQMADIKYDIRDQAPEHEKMERRLFVVQTL